MSYYTAPRVQFGSDSYDAFGILVRVDSDTLHYYYRQGMYHKGDKGKIVKRVYTISADSWSAVSHVYENQSLDTRGVGGGSIGNHIYLFFGKWDRLPKRTVSLGYIRSTDLTGTSWSCFTELRRRGQAYGQIVPTSLSDTYLQPFYLYTRDREEHVVGTLRTTDGGETWAEGDPIYHGVERAYNETCIAYIGSGKMIGVIRAETGGYLEQVVSDDDGKTWSKPSLTSLGAPTGRKVPWICYDAETNRVIAVYMCRGDDAMKVSEADSQTVHADPGAWGEPHSFDSWGHSLNGYASAAKVSSRWYFLAYSAHMGRTNADIRGLYYPIGGSPSVVGI